MNRKLVRVLALAVPLVAGCATMQKETFIKEQAGDYAYKMPLEQVWPHVGAMLQERGYAYKEAPGGRFLLATEWKEEEGPSDMGKRLSQYSVEGEKIDDEHCRVRFTRNTMSSAAAGQARMTSTQRQNEQLAAEANGAVSGVASRDGSAATSVRDFDAEWLLIQRVAPEDAKQIQAEADRQYP